ncbi:hypothetical protein XELAEV_18008267mg [Xenopus laevis]|uniref:Uncharacterized protein n=1 Tax=Xenopus laevis TaxID=8355 RepID=A0A974E3D4_XENLA|nr:hypothetical protein XELAEV_18008267mg [Xenopus laevis]
MAFRYSLPCEDCEGKLGVASRFQSPHSCFFKNDQLYGCILVCWQVTVLCYCSVSVEEEKGNRKKQKTQYRWKQEKEHRKENGKKLRSGLKIKGVKGKKKEAEVKEQEALIRAMGENKGGKGREKENLKKHKEENRTG